MTRAVISLTLLGMIKCVLLTSDTKSAMQMRAWFRLFQSEPYLEIVTSVEAFEAKYNQPFKPKEVLIDDSPPDQDDMSRAAKLEIEAESTMIKLLIVDLDVIPSRPLDWVVAQREKLQENGHIGAAVPLKIMLLGYDDPNVRPDHFRHEFVDDMVIKPLDQQLFLQKVELLLADKPDLPPSFLFKAQAEGTIEIGKDAIIDEISDFAISIRNPGPLADGVFAQVHSTVFGSEMDTSRILARAYASVRHPQYEGLWLVRFALFGINSAQLGELRKFIRGRQIPGRTKPPAPARKATKKEKIPPRYRVAVIDLNRDVLAQAQGAIEENFEKTGAVLFPSYTRLLAGLAKLSGAGQAAGEDEEGTDSEGGIPNGGRLTLNVTDGEFKLLGISPKLPMGEYFLGRPLNEWMARPDSWLQAVPKKDHEDFQEFLTYTSTGGQGVTGVRFIDNDGNIVFAEINGKRTVSTDPEIPNTLHLELKQIERSAWVDLNRMATKGDTPDNYRFDALMIDGSLIRTDIGSWLDGLHTALTRAKVIAKTDPLPRIFILADEGSPVTPENFAHRGIIDFIYKPLDRKLFTDKIAAALPQLSRSVPLDASPFVPCELVAQLCKQIELGELSEFGLMVKHPTPFKPKSFMRFFSPLFGNSAEGLIGRCVASVAGMGDDPTYKCHFIFFGASDELHKKIRNWIREDYVQKKEAGA